MLAPQVQLARMRGLLEAVDKEDDWTGTTNAEIRRKIQNRLNVRAYRRRKALEAKAHQAYAPIPGTPDANTEPGVLCWVEDEQAVTIFPASVVKTLDSVDTRILPYRFATPSTLQLSRPATASVIFPLSSDHLIPLIQFNVLRGSLTIRLLLSPLNSKPLDECWTQGLNILPLPSTSHSVPPSLYPTALQRTVPHEEWIDAIPHPVMRDNFILATGTFDENELWSDMVGGLFEGLPASEIELRGVIAWSPPWDATGWELSKGFLRKWGWCLKGCEEVLEATNRWRQIRGEDPLLFEP